MDAIEKGTTSLKNVSIFLTSLSNHLYGKIRSRKPKLTCVLIVKEVEVMVAWVLFMQKIGLSMSLQQLKMKVAELIQTMPTHF